MSKKTNSFLSAAELRRGLEKLDGEIVKLANQRAELAQQLAESGDAAKATDEAALEKLAAGSKGPLQERSVRAMLRELQSGCRALFASRRVAYLGPEYSYSHIAALERFGQGAELVPVGTIAAVFEEVLSGQSHFGLVPMENSTDGRIADTLTMFTKTPARICGEVQLRVHHNLIGKCARAEIKEVHSKPQAISQCRDWLAKHLPQAVLVEATSTTAAAELAAKKPGVAAIASRQAAVNCGLDVIAGNIEDNKNNVTRFAVIGEQPSRRTKHDKTAVMFQVEHKPGALADAMNLFKRARLNLTWIESFPMPGVPNEYLFFVELEGHEGETRVKRALELLRKKTVRLEVLGSYEKREMVES